MEGAAKPRHGDGLQKVVVLGTRLPLPWSSCRVWPCSWHFDFDPFAQFWLRDYMETDVFSSKPMTLRCLISTAVANQYRSPPFPHPRLLLNCPPVCLGLQAGNGPEVTDRSQVVIAPESEATARDLSTAAPKCQVDTAGELGGPGEVRVVFVSVNFTRCFIPKQGFKQDIFCTKILT